MLLVGVFSSLFKHIIQEVVGQPLHDPRWVWWLPPKLQTFLPRTARWLIVWTIVRLSCSTVDSTQELQFFTWFFSVFFGPLFQKRMVTETVWFLISPVPWSLWWFSPPALFEFSTPINFFESDYMPVSKHVGKQLCFTPSSNQLILQICIMLKQTETSSDLIRSGIFPAFTWSFRSLAANLSSCAFFPVAIWAFQSWTMVIQQRCLLNNLLVDVYSI